VRVGLTLDNGGYNFGKRPFWGFTSGVRDTGQIISKYPTWMTHYISSLSMQLLAKQIQSH